jgi:uncharacterized protein (DUF2141 family)
MTLGQTAPVDLVIRVSNIPADTVQVAVALYDRKDTYLSEDSANAATVPFDAGDGDSVTLVLKGMPSGLYAIIALADRDGDARLKRGALGLPLEFFGFGNNAMGLFGSPSFDKALVRVVPPKTEISIRLRPPPFGAGTAK